MLPQAQLALPSTGEQSVSLLSLLGLNFMTVVGLLFFKVKYLKE
ncbi:LPXTG cell wall anchor domain-containing protein [Streptococcus canis]